MSLTLSRSVSWQLLATFQTLGCIFAGEGRTSFIPVPIDSMENCHLSKFGNDGALSFQVRVKTVDAVIDQLSAARINPYTNYQPIFKFSFISLLWKGASG